MSWKPAAGAGLLTQKASQVSKGLLSFNFDDEEQERREFLEKIEADCKAVPGLKDIKKEMATVPAKVNSVVPSDRQTAWGFPSMSLANADEKAKRAKWNKAGSPTESLQTGTGKPLIHTRWIENE